jgi:hypothetical protein
MFLDGWVDGWVGVKAVLRIAYSNQKQILEKIYFSMTVLRGGFCYVAKPNY